jgi:hypothetical protein
MGGRAMDRRRFLQVAGAGGAAVVLSSALGADWAAAATHRRVYVLVVDGCRPDEIDETVTPRLHALRTDGTHYPNARSLPVMETIPNHTTMMAGMRPNRTGVPANSVYDRAEGTVRDLDRPSDLRAPTVLDRLQTIGLTTGSVLSKEYLHGIFGTRATYRWEPSPVVPVSGHAPDPFTMDAALAMLREADPAMMAVNLGDCDRVGHADLTGTTLAAARTAALASADAQVGRFVDALRSSGRWPRSVVVVLADHSMDWSYPDRVVSLASVFDGDPLLVGRVQAAQNGGADLLYWTGSAGRRDAAVRRCVRWPPTRRGCCRCTRPASCASARRPGTWWRTAGPDGGSASRSRCRTRYRATTGTRRPSRSRSSSAAAPTWCGHGTCRASR